MTHVWYWRKRPAGALPDDPPQDRKGQPCRIVATGRKRSALIEFEDGYRVVTSRWAVRRIDR